MGTLTFRVTNRNDGSLYIILGSESNARIKTIIIKKLEELSATTKLARASTRN